jgi:enterochelin esterase-like enzyme
MIVLLGLVACSQEMAAAPTALPASPLPGVTAVITIAPDSTHSSPNTPAPIASPTPAPSLTLTPSLTATPTPEACLSLGGQVQITQLETDLLPHPLAYRVYTPPCYAEHPIIRYPVLYLIHGQSFDDEQWDRMGIDETADRLIAAGEIAPLIIVLPRDRFWTQPSEDHFGEAIMDVLIPTIDDVYRTRAERSFRAIGGLSRGGSWALHLGTQYWQSFSAIGGHSAPIFWEDAPTIRGWIESIPPDQMPRFYLDLSSNDRPEITDSALGFERLLTRLDIAHEFYLFQGYHEEAYWSAHLEQYLRWYAAEWGK